MTTLAKNIRYLRRKKRLSQDDLAEKLGYKSYTTIQKWEESKSEPTMAKFRMLADLWGVDMHEMATVDLEAKDNELRAHQDWQPVITPKDERDVEKELEAMLNGDAVLAAYGGKLPDDMDEQEKEDYELYIAAMRTMLMHAKKLNKQRHTPLKYRTFDE